MNNRVDQYPSVSISVIIPAYNAERSIDDCVRSILTQSYSNWELIIVNDGSTDATAARAEAWQKRDARIHLIDQKNKGRSAARNAGLERAQGEWILFLDADDYYLPNAFSELLAKAGEGDAVWGSFDCKNGATCFLRDVFVPVDEVAKNILILSEIKQWTEGCQSGMICRTSWGKLFRRSILSEHNIRFVEGLRFGEDAIFNLDYLNYITTVRLIPTVIYFYVISDTSTTHTFEPRDCDYLLAYVNAIDSLSKRLRLNITDKLWDVFVASEANSLLMRCLNYSTDSAHHLSMHFVKVFSDPRVITALDSLPAKSAISRFYRPFKLYLLKHRHIATFIRLRRFKFLFEKHL